MGTAYNPASGKGLEIAYFTAGRNQGEGAYLVSYDRVADEYKPLILDAFSTSIAVNGVTELTVTSNGNIGIGITDPSRKLFVNGDAGGTTAWYNDSHSSYKEEFEDVSVLDKVSKLNIKEWQYKEEHTTADNSRHISPFAEEFYHIMDLGNSEKQIQALDVAGVALKAIQEQQELLLKQQVMIEELKKQITELKNNRF